MDISDKVAFKDGWGVGAVNFGKTKNANSNMDSKTLSMEGDR